MPTQRPLCRETGGALPFPQPCAHLWNAAPMPIADDLTRDDLTHDLVWRFHRHYAPTDLHGCWPWQGPTTPNGYGTLRQGSRDNLRTFLAHRLSWVLYSGRPLLDGITVDHRCFRHGCVNPLHLDPVSARVNSERAQQRA